MLSVTGRSILNKSLLGRATARSFSMELQASIPKGAPPVRGFDIVSNRLANIVLNITEKKPSNVLHVYPENNTLAYIGEVNYLAMSSLRNAATTEWGNFDDASKYTVQQTLPSFKNVAESSLPFESNHFSIVINALPVYKTSTSSSTGASTVECVSPAMLPLAELVRVTTGQGNLLLGAPEALWDSLEFDAQIQSLTNRGFGHMMVALRLPLPLEDLARLPVTANTLSDDSVRFAAATKVERIRMGDLAKEPNNERQAISYKMGVFRRI